MKKIVFSHLPISATVNKGRYVFDGNKSAEYDGEVMFPINAVLAKTLKADDEVKVVLLEKRGLIKKCDYSDEFKKELDGINGGIGATLKYVTIDVPSEETRTVHERTMRSMIDFLEQDADVYADITFGSKPLPIISFLTLGFAEKFFACNVKYVVYGKINRDINNNPINHTLFDVTPLYYLNAVTDAIDCTSGEQAKKILDTILGM